MNWAYFVLGIVVSEIAKPLAMVINRAIVERRNQKFIRLLNVTFPDRKAVTIISVDTSDKRALRRLERELREEYGITDPLIPEEPSPMKRQT